MYQSVELVTESCRKLVASYLAIYCLPSYQHLPDISLMEVLAWYQMSVGCIGLMFVPLCKCW